MRRRPPTDSATPSRAAALRYHLFCCRHLHPHLPATLCWNYTIADQLLHTIGGGQWWVVLRASRQHTNLMSAMCCAVQQDLLTPLSESRGGWRSSEDLVGALAGPRLDSFDQAIKRTRNPIALPHLALKLDVLSGPCTELMYTSDPNVTEVRAGCTWPGPHVASRRH